MGNFFAVLLALILWVWPLKTPNIEVGILNPVSSPKHVLVTKNEIISYARDVAQEKGISEELFIKVLLRESGASSSVIGDWDIPYKGEYSRGCFQINTYYWPDITNEQAFDCEWSIHWAAEQFKKGRVDIFTSIWKK